MNWFQSEQSLLKILKLLLISKRNENVLSLSSVRELEPAFRTINIVINLFC